MNTNYCDINRISDAIISAVDILTEKQNLSTIPGIPSGFPSIDKLTQGWKSGELIVIGGRPGVGKSTLALQMARNSAVQFELPSAIFSMQISSIEATNLLISAETGIPPAKIEGEERMSKDDWTHLEASLRKLSMSQLFIDDTPGLSPSDIRERAKHLVKYGHIRSLFIDNLQTMPPDKDLHSSRMAISEILCSLKETSSAFRIPIIVLTNVARPERSDYNGPIITDLDEYCPLSTDYADKIFLLNRPGLIHLDQIDDKLVEIKLVRNKTGKTGSVNLVFNKDYNQLSELSEVLEEENP